MRLRGTLILGFLPFVGVASRLDAQVIISPSVVLLGDNARIGSISVRNQSGRAQEVSVTFRFGYPQSDSAGNLVVRYDDAVMAERHSMAAWLSAFPRQFVIAPGSEQVVRLVAQPPAMLADGAYWTRLAVASQPQAPSIGSPGALTAQVTLRLEQVNSVIFRRGAQTSTVSVGQVTTGSREGNGQLLIPLEREGSSPFLGNLTVHVRDPSGAVVATGVVPISVYFASVYRVRLPPEAWRSGTRYEADITVTPGRSDIPAGRLPPADPVTARVIYTPG